ncbi:hypothetical protein SGPA1_51028 [Streptomyces misionensis JCM 4497]
MDTRCHEHHGASQDPRSRRWVRRPVRSSAHPQEDALRRGDRHGRRPPVVHDLPALPPRSRRRQHLPSPCRRPAATRASEGGDPHRSGHHHRPGPQGRHDRPAGGRGVRAAVRLPGHRHGRGLPHLPDPRPRRAGHRHEGHRGVHRPAQPRAGAAGQGRLHDRRGDPPQGAHLRLHRRWLRGCGDHRRGRGHGPGRRQVLPQRLPRGHAVHPRRRRRQDPSRGRPQARPVRQGAPGEPWRGDLPLHLHGVLRRRPRGAEERTRGRLQHHRVDGRRQAEPGPRPLRSPARPARPRGHRRHPPGAGHGLHLGRRRQRPGPGPRRPQGGQRERLVPAERPARAAPGQGARRQRGLRYAGLPAEGVRARQQGCGRRSRPAQGRGDDRHGQDEDQAQGPSRLVHAPRLPRSGHADLEPQDPHLRRLDARHVPQARGRVPGCHGEPPRGVLRGRQARAGRRREDRGQGFLTRGTRRTIRKTSRHPWCGRSFGVPGGHLGGHCNFLPSRNSIAGLCGTTDGVYVVTGIRDRRLGGVRHGRRRVAAEQSCRADAGGSAPGSAAGLGRITGRASRRSHARRAQPARPAPHPVQAGRAGPGPRLGRRGPGHRGRPVHGAGQHGRADLGARGGRAHPPPGRARPRCPRRRPRAAQARRPADPARAAARGGPQTPSSAHPWQRQARHQPPLRRRQRLLRAGPRSLDGVLLRLLGVLRQGRHPGGRPARQARTGLPEARSEGGPAAAGRRLRLGLHGPARGPGARGERRRGHPLPGAGRVRPQARRRRGTDRPGGDQGPGLPGRHRRPLRRDLLHRHGRARRRRTLPGVRPPAVRPAHTRRPAAQPPDRPPPAARRIRLQRGRVHRRLRLPGR